MSASSPRDRHLVSTDWLAANSPDPAVRVFDCTVNLYPLPDNSGNRAESGRPDYDKGHIAESAFLDLSADLSVGTSPLRFAVPSAEAFAASASRLGIGEGTRVVLYDRKSNQWAARVWWMLRGFGFDNVKVLDGGYVKWMLEKRPVTTAPKAYPAARFTARPRPARFAGKELVKAAIGDSSVRLLNALTPEQHAGEGGVHYGRRGRIPGSCNVPARGLTDPVTQAFLPDAALRARFEGSGALDSKAVITYCGGGIAAANAALGLALLGIDNVSIYTNSLQEWANDPSCPMELG